MPRSQRSTGPAVTLFPFLAVLLCLMGSLVFLLIALSAKVGEEPQLIAAAPTSVVLPPAEPFAWPKPDPVIYDAAVLPANQSQADVDAPLLVELRRIADETAAVDAHLQQRQSELRSLDAEAQRRAARLAKAKSVRDADALSLTAARKDATDLEKQLAALTASEAELRKANAAADAADVVRPTEFKFLPVDRLTGTQRDPIIVECRAGTIDFPAEEVSITHAAFVGRRYSDNPLTNVLEALTAHYGAKGKRPYTLVIVRPGGEDSFLVTRGLLTASGRPWGYELVPDNMELSWPPADATAKQLAASAVDPRGRGGSLLPGRELDGSGDLFGSLRRQRNAALAMTGGGGSGRRPSSGSVGFGPPGPGNGVTGFEAIARGRFANSQPGSSTAQSGRYDSSRAGGSSPQRPNGRSEGLETARDEGSGPADRNRNRVLAENARQGSSSSEETTPEGSRHGNSRFAEGGTMREFETSPNGSMTSNRSRQSLDSGPHWQTPVGTSGSGERSLTASSSSGPKGSSPSRSASAKSSAAGPSAGGTRSSGPKTADVRTSQSAAECLACKNKPWTPAAGGVGFERTIRIRVGPDSLSSGDLTLPSAGTYPSKTLARLLTELTLAKFDEWGEPRAGTYWSPAIALEGSGPMAIRVEQAGEIADIPVRRITARPPVRTAARRTVPQRTVPRQSGPRRTVTQPPASRPFGRLR